MHSNFKSCLVICFLSIIGDSDNNVLEIANKKQQNPILSMWRETAHLLAYLIYAFIMYHCMENPMS